MKFSLREIAPEAISRWIEGQPRPLQFIMLAFYIGIPALAFVTIVTTIIFPNFIFSISYTAQIGIRAVLLGACLFFPLAVLIVKNGGLEIISMERRILEALLLVCLGAIAVYTIASQTVPLLAVMINGHPIAMDRHIDSIRINSSRKQCRVVLMINDPVFPHICNPPSAIWQENTGIQNIHVDGYGTSLGMFWTKIELLPN